MIAGVGVDLVSLSRFESLHARWGARLERRLFGAGELAELPADPRRRVRRMALAFAAKEAFAKALGTGLRPPASLHRIAVRRDALGAPRCEARGELARELERRSVTAAHLSLSDEGDSAVAVAVLETG